VRQALAQLAQEGIGIPARLAGREQLARLPTTQHVHDSAVDEEHWPVISCASSAPRATTIGELLAGSGGSNPSSGADISPNAASVIRVRAFGASALTVTPSRWSSCAAISVKPTMPAFAAP
jgi:hypothetical protein